MELKIDFRHYLSEPHNTEPEWAHLVERWYQIDLAAHVLASAAWKWRQEFPKPPDFIFLASPGSSNVTDKEFVDSQTSSAAKFVHTLPNVRGSALCQVLNWTGPMICLQNDPATVLSGLSEAMDEFSFAPREIWVCGVEARDAYLFRFSLKSEGNLILSREEAAMATKAEIDSAFIGWLTNNHKPLSKPFTWTYGQWKRNVRAL